jgi:hypothetical protein
MIDQQKETRAQLIESITTGIAGVVGADPTAALTASQSEADNNLNRKQLDKLKNAYCSTVPTGRSVSASGALGGIGAVSGGGDMVLNYNSGQTSLFATGGMSLGWNGGASVTASSGLVYGLDGTNNGFSGPFKGGSFSAPTPIPFVSAGGSVVHSGGVTVVSAGASAALVGRYGFGISATNTSKPLNIGNFSGFSLGDFIGYLARRPCN